MGDVITKFKLETTQFDSKLRDSAQEMSKLTQYLKNAGGEFDRFAQKHVDAAKALGQTESGATNLKDKLRDLVSAYNNVAKAYENLTVEQQKTDFGKAMASSLDQLQQRITQTKNELYSMTDTTKQAEGGLGSLNNIFGVSISKLAGWGAAISVAKGALDVAKDAFFASEANVDEWGRTVESSKAIYEGFLTSINTGDISGYLSRVSQISQAARDAYDALDLLGTQKTIQSPQLAKKQAEITRMRSILQTGVFIESADGLKSAAGLKNGDKLSKEQLNTVAKQLESAMMEVANITKSQVKSATDAIDKMYNEQALILGVSKQKFKQVTSSWEEFQVASNMADEYNKWRAAHTISSTMNTSTGAVVNYEYDDSKNPYRQWAWLSTFKDDGERYQQLVTEIQNREAAKSGLYSQYGQIYRRINKVEGYNPFGGGGGDTNKEVEEAAKGIGILTKQLQELQKAQSQALNPEAWQEMQKEIERMQTHIEAFKGKWKDGMQATFSVSVNDTEAYDKLKNLPNVLVDEDSIKVTADTAEAYLNCQKLFEDIENEKVEFKVVPKLNPDELFPDLDITEPSVSIFEKAKSAARERLAGEMISVDEETFATILQDAVKHGIESLDPVLQELQLKIPAGVSDEEWQKIIDQYNELRQQIGEDPIKIDLKTGKEVSGKGNNGQDLHSLINNVANISRSLQDLGVEVPEGFSNVINIMNIIQTIISTISTISGISSVGSALGNIPIVGSIFSFFGGLFGFSNGGIVPHAANGAYIGGNHFSGDVTPVLANAGEVILNRSSQGILGTALDVIGGNLKGGTSEVLIESDTIKIVLQNGAQAKGQTLGQYLGLV